MPLPTVHLITDRSLVHDLARAVRAATAGASPGTVAVHLREKDLGGRALLALARELRDATAAAGQLLLVNDRVDVALAAGADGVHLPAAGIPPAEARRLVAPGRLVGVSCHSVEDVRRARAGGADYATFGPVFDTPSKRAYGAPPGLPALEEAARLGLPLVALGGIDPSSAAAARAAGAAGVAAIRSWLTAPDPAAAVLALRGTMTDDHRHHGHQHGHHGKPGRDPHGNPEDLAAYVEKLLAPDRDEWQRPGEVLDALRIAPGDAVAEIGAGAGWFTEKLARAVGEAGRVDAVDVEPALLAILRERLAGAPNVRAIQGEPADPRLPGAAYRAILVVNTFHHLVDGPAWLAALARRLAPGGRLVVVDFHDRETPVGPPVEHRIAREDFLAAVRAAGLEVAEERTSLPYQWLFALVPR